MIKTEDLLIYDVLYKYLIGEKHLCLMFDKVDRFISDCNVTKHLALFSSEKYNAILNRIGYLTRIKSDISYAVSRNYGKIKIDLDNDLALKIIDFAYCCHTY